MANIPPLTTCVERDDPTVNRTSIHIQIAQLLASDDAIEHRASDLHQHYSPAQIKAYDVTALGFAAAADLLASQIPTDSPVHSYLDLGTGTGTTAIACSRVLSSFGVSFELLLVDGLRDMLIKAMGKIDVQLPISAGLRSIYVNVEDILSDLEKIRADILKHRYITDVSLITAQRIFLNVRKDRRSQQLRQWAAFLSQDGKLIIDIPHPRRHIGAMFLGAGSVNPNAMSPPLEICRVLTDENTWQECRDYARQLATEANLVITNTMPAQLPPQAGRQDGLPALWSWVDSCRATTISDPLSRDELDWFGRRYFQAAASYYRDRGVLCTADIAAVVAVFERAPVTKATTLTKYVIDESLTGKARKNAIKRAAKEGKKKARERGDHDDEGAGGAGMAA